MKFPLTIVGVFLLTGILGPWFLGNDALSLDIWKDLQSPLEAGGLGRIENGASLFAWLVAGARTSVIVASIATLVSISIGTFYGALAGYLGGFTETLLMQVINILLGFPGILLAIYMASILKPSLYTLIFALSSMGWLGFARIIRVQIKSLVQQDYILAAKSLGAKSPRIFFYHLLPGLLNIILVQSTYSFSLNILSEASLSFLGLGLPPGTPSWGALIDQGVVYLFAAPHIVIISGACLFMVILAFNRLGDELQKYFEQRERWLK